MRTKQIETVAQISKKEFNARYLKAQQPVLLKGFTKQFPATSKWNLNYMKKVCGDVEVDIYDGDKSTNGTAFTHGDKKMLFKDYAAIIEQQTQGNLRMFLFNMFKKRPQLRKEYPCPAIMRGVLQRMGYLFFGAKGVKVRMHQDIDNSNVLLTQFYGRKKVLLVAPEYSDFLYKLPLGTFSPADISAPDYEKFPALRHIEVLECTLHPGDALFMPSGYWHHITYIDGGFSVSYRKMAQSPKALFIGALNVLVFLPLDKLLHFFGGEAWYRTKLEIAYAKAAQALQREENTHTGVLRTQTN